MTFNQLCSFQKKGSYRLTKSHRCRSPQLRRCPQRKGICIKVYTVKPKKPNSAIRKIAKLRLTTKRNILAYIPGQGHTLQQFSTVLVRGGRVPDLPGIRYHIIRGKYDFTGLENFERRSRRSKFSRPKLFRR